MAQASFSLVRDAEARQNSTPSLTKFFCTPVQKPPMRVFCMTRIFSAAIALALSTGIGHAASLGLGAEAPALTPIGHIA
jgi:hypothetical protein